MSRARRGLGRARRALGAGVRELLHPAPPPIIAEPTSPPPDAEPARLQPRGVSLSDGRVMCGHPVAPHMILDGHCLLVTPPVLMGTYEPAVTRFLRSVVQPGDVVVDIGANQGFHTLTLGMCVGPSGRVWAFEPHPRTRRILLDNVATNGLHHVVTVIDAAAWSEDAQLTFRARAGEAAGSYLRDAFSIPDDAIDGEDLVVRAIDTGAFLAGLPSPPQLIKLDAEGSEQVILRSAAEVLREHHPTVVLEVLPSSFESSEAIDEWERWIRDLGYQIAYLEHFGTAPLEGGTFRSLKHGVEAVLWVPGGRGSLSET